MEGKINLLNSDLSQYKDSMNAFIFNLASSILPIFKKLDFSKIDKSSKYELFFKNDNKTNLYVQIIPVDDSALYLSLEASESHCNLGYAESEIFEFHNITNDTEGIVSEITSNMEKYLNGYKVKEYFNKKNRIIKKEYFFTNNSKPDHENKIGTGTFFSLNRKIANIKEYEIKLFK